MKTMNKFSVYISGLNIFYYHLFFGDRYDYYQQKANKTKTILEIKCCFKDFNSYKLTNRRCNINKKNDKFKLDINHNYY